MQKIKLPTHYYSVNNYLIPVSETELNFRIDTQTKIDDQSLWRVIYDTDNKTILAIDPDSGPFMRVGAFTINGMILDSVDNNYILHFKKIDNE